MHRQPPMRQMREPINPRITLLMLETIWNQRITRMQPQGTRLMLPLIQMEERIKILLQGMRSRMLLQINHQITPLKPTQIWNQQITRMLPQQIKLTHLTKTKTQLHRTKTKGRTQPPTPLLKMETQPPLTTPQRLPPMTPPLRKMKTRMTMMMRNRKMRTKETRTTIKMKMK